MFPIWNHFHEPAIAVSVWPVLPSTIRKYNLLPLGMYIEPYYDRGTLTRLTTHTVLENLVVGMLLVSIVLWVFLGETRAAVLSAVNIPLALLCAFVGMVATGTPANLISLGAVDF